MISLVLVEDQNTILQLLKIYLEQELDLEVVGMAVNGEEAVNKIQQLQPDVVLMDIEMPKLDGLSATRIISQRFPQTKVIILSTHYSESYLNAALQAGAKGYLLKNTPPKELLNTIRVVNQGHSKLDTGLLKQAHLKISGVKSSHQSRPIDRSETAPIQQLPKIKPKALLNYLGVGLVLNLLVWTLSLAYLKFSTPLYTSEWRVKILATDSGEEIFTEEDKLLSLPRAWSPSFQQDPSHNYVELATSSQVLEKAADLMGIRVEDFGEPEITVQENSGLLDFSLGGRTPEEAQQKALGFYQVMSEQVEALLTKEREKQKPRFQISQEDSLQELAANQAELSQLVAPNQELETQITQLIQLVTEPTRPEKPTTPSLRSALRGGIAGSSLVTIGLFFWWYYQANLLSRALSVKNKLIVPGATASEFSAELGTSRIPRLVKTREKVPKKAESRKELTERRQLLTHAPNHIRAAINPEAMLQAAATEVRQVIAADRVVVYSLDEQSPGKVIAESVEAGYPQALGAVIDDSCFSAHDLEKYQNGRFKAIDDIYQANLTRRQLNRLKSLTVKAHLVVPILTQGKLIGLLIAHHCAASHAWQQWEIKVVVQMAKRLGLVLDNANLLGSLYKLLEVDKS